MALIWSRREAAFANLRRWLYCKNDQIKLIPFNNHTKHEVILVFKYLSSFSRPFCPRSQTKCLFRTLRRMQKYCGVGWWSWSENHTYLFKVFVFYVASLPDRHIFQWNIEKGRMFTAVRRVDKCPACSPGRRELFLEVCGQIPHSWDRQDDKCLAGWACAI